MRKIHLINVLVLLVTMLMATIGSGFIFKISHYENNVISLTPKYDRLLISDKSYNKIAPRIKNNYFSYFDKDGNVKKQKILFKKQHDHTWEIILKSINPNPNTLQTEIKYFLNKTPYWYNIFK